MHFPMLDKVTIWSMGSKFNIYYIFTKPTNQGFQIHNQNLILIGNRCQLSIFLKFSHKARNPPKCHNFGVRVMIKHVIIIKEGMKLLPQYFSLFHNIFYPFPLSHALKISKTN